MNALVIMNCVKNSQYLYGIMQIPWVHIKFMDESHFDHRTLYQRRGWARSDRRLMSIKPPTPGVQSCSITIMTNLNHPGGFVMTNPILGRNKHDHFVRFVCEMILKEYLVPGDYLIADNAPIHHKGAAILHDLLRDVGIHLRWLPAYSPELNPCEMIFANIKQYIRNNRSDKTIPEELIPACARIGRDTVVKYYGHCIDRIVYGSAS
jgi:hypothetical protein